MKRHFPKAPRMAWLGFCMPLSAATAAGLTRKPLPDVDPKLEQQMAHLHRTTQVTEAIILALFILWPLAVGFLSGRQTDWGRRRVIALAPLPTPLLLAILCAILIFKASTSTPQQCGVDACGMAIAAAMSVLAMALLGYLVGMMLAWPAFALGRRRRAPDPGSQTL